MEGKRGEKVGVDVFMMGISVLACLSKSILATRNRMRHTRERSILERATIPRYKLLC